MRPPTPRRGRTARSETAGFSRPRESRPASTWRWRWSNVTVVRNSRGPSPALWWCSCSAQADSPSSRRRCRCPGPAPRSCDPSWTPWPRTRPVTTLLPGWRGFPDGAGSQREHAAPAPDVRRRGRDHPGHVRRGSEAGRRSWCVGARCEGQRRRATGGLSQPGSDAQVVPTTTGCLAQRLPAALLVGDPAGSRGVIVARRVRRWGSGPLCASTAMATASMTVGPSSL